MKYPFLINNWTVLRTDAAWEQFHRRLLILMQNFMATQSAILQKMTLEVAIFGNFPDISELKMSLCPRVRAAGCDIV